MRADWSCTAVPVSSVVFPNHMITLITIISRGDLEPRHIGNAGIIRAIVYADLVIRASNGAS